jgi:hypothetical protein
MGNKDFLFKPYRCLIELKQVGYFLANLETQNLTQNFIFIFMRYPS